MAIPLRSAELTAAYADLFRLAELPPNWDGDGSRAPTSEALVAAQQLLNWTACQASLTQPTACLPFAIAPLSGSGVLLDWRCQAADLEVDIGPAGQLGYLFIDRTGPERRFEEDDDVSLDRIHALLLRAFSSK